MIENMNESIGIDPIPSTTIGLRDGMTENLLQIVWRQRWLVAMTMGAVVSLAILYLLIATPRFTSRASLYLEYPGSALTGQRSGSSDEAATHRQTQSELITTAPILADALLRSEAGQMKTFESVGDSISYMQNKLTVEVGRKSNIITLLFDSPYPQEATRVVKGVVDAYLAHSTGHNQSTASDMLTALKEERKSRDDEHQLLLSQIQRYQSEHEMSAVENPEQVNERLDKLSNALTNAQISRVEAEAAYNVEVAVLSQKDGVTQLVESRLLDGAGAMDSEYRQLQEDLYTLNRNLAGLRKRWGSNHKLVKEGEASAAFLSKRLTEKRTRMTAAHLARLSRRVAATRSTQTQVQSEYDLHRKRAAESNSLGMVLSRMKNDLSQLEKRREQLDSRLQELSVQKNTASISVSLLEPAHSLLKASWPRPGQILGLGICGGFMFGIFMALVRDWKDQRYRTAQQIQQALGAPVISTIGPIQGDDSPTSRGQLVQLDPSSAASEAYRDIRTAIFFSRKSRDVKTLLITSAAENDGKSTVASNLAIAMAQTGRRVLIIDCDMRQATQHEIFRVKNQVGLSSILAANSAVVEAITHTSVANLDLLPAGPAPRNPSELLHNSAMTNLMAQARQDYDYVIIDSTPIAAVTDGRIVAANCDATLMVVRPSQGNRRICEMAAQSLKDVGAYIMGVVVNDTNNRFDNPAQQYYGKYGKPSHGTSTREEPVMVRLINSSLPIPEPELEPVAEPGICQSAFRGSIT